MKFCKWMKDGGPQSRVDGFFLVEIKGLFSIVLLHFHDGARDSYHTHAFNAVSWLLRGRLIEFFMYGGWQNVYLPSIAPIFTPRQRFHKVFSDGSSWVLSFRGPWSDRWKEYLPKSNREINLTHGRKVVV